MGLLVSSCLPHDEDHVRIISNQFAIEVFSYSMSLLNREHWYITARHKHNNMFNSKNYLQYINTNVILKSAIIFYCLGNGVFQGDVYIDD